MNYLNILSNKRYFTNDDFYIFHKELYKTINAIKRPGEYHGKQAKKKIKIRSKKVS